MHGRGFFIFRSIFLSCCLLGLGWYLHLADAKVHNSVDADPVTTTATIAQVKDTKVGGTYLIVDFTDDQQRPDRTHIWYGWTTTKFKPGEQVQIDYSESSPLDAYATDRSVSDNLRIYEYAVPVVILISMTFSALVVRLTRRRPKVLAPA